MSLERGAELAGRLLNHAGPIRLDAARVGGGITTTSSDINIGADSHVEGGILIRRRDFLGVSAGDFRLGIPIGRSAAPRVVIGPRAVVRGVLRFKRPVELLVSVSASIGPIEGATAVMFAGATPPR